MSCLNESEISDHIIIEIVADTHLDLRDEVIVADSIVAVVEMQAIVAVDAAVVVAA